MPQTRQDLITLVLENIGVLAAGQSASIEDRDTVNRRIDVKLSELAKREVIAGLDADALDDGVFLYVADVIGYACRVPFGITGAKADLLAKASADAEVVLKGMARQYSTTAATAGFDVVRDVLERLGVVTPGQDPSQQDRGVVSARIPPMLADLRQREIVAFASLGAADPSALIHLSAILALACAVPFKVAATDLPPIQAMAGQAEAALRLIARQLDAGVATAGTFDVVQAVLENLGVVIAGYSGSAKDRAVVLARVAPTLADLRLREIADIASLAAADPGTLIHLSTILTSACSQAFGIAVEARALLAAEAGKAEAALKALARQLDNGTATSTVFDPVQAALEMIGIVSAGQSASEKDRAVVHARVQPVLLELHGRDVCGVTDLSMLSIELQRAFAKILAAECAASFSEVAMTRVAWLEAKVPEAERTLRYQSFVYDARPPMRIEPFWGRRSRGAWVV